MSDEEFKQARAKMSTTVDIEKMYVDLEQSKHYAEFRPRYSDELFKTIVDFCKETNPNLDLALDVGCGPGMSTLGFCKYFKKVIGVDVSETQVACAPQDIPNCEFKVGYSDKLSFIESESVDLFCTGESFHYMPHKETFAEADRVLKPGGTIALFGYCAPPATHPEIDQVIRKQFVKFIPYWPVGGDIFFDKYKDVILPYSDYTRNNDLKITGSMSLDDYMGYVRSLWPFVAYSREHPEVDLGAEIRSQMMSAIAKVNPSGDQKFDSVWELFIVMGHKPKK